MLKQVSVLEKLALCYFFGHTVWSVFKDEYITCVFTCKQAARREVYKVNIPRKFYVGLVRAYNFMNRIAIIYPLVS